MMQITKAYNHWRIRWATERLRDAKICVSLSPYVSQVTGQSRFRSALDLLSILFNQNIPPTAAVESGMHLVARDDWNNFVSMRQLASFRRHMVADSDYSRFSSKLNIYRNLDKLNVPVPPVLSVIDTQELLSDDDHKVINNVHELKALFNQYPEYETFIIKPIFGLKGQGIYIYERPSDQFFHPDKTPKSKEGVFPSIHELGREFYKPGYLVQPFLHAHPDVVAITGSRSLSTVRVTTVRKDGEVCLLFAQMKLIFGESYIDNYNGGKLGNVFSPVDILKGTMSGLVGVFFPDHERVPYWRTTEPVNGTQFQGIPVPCWDEIKQTVLRAASVYPNVNTIGWDVAATDSGVVVIEGNPYWGVGSTQLSHRKGIKPDLANVAPGAFPGKS